MNLPTTREPLVWALGETARRLREISPDSADERIREMAAFELRGALRCNDLKAIGRSWVRDGEDLVGGRLGKIPMELWYDYGALEPLIRDIEEGMLDPWPDDPAGRIYTDPTVLRASLRDWLDRSTPAQTPPRPKHAGGAPQRLRWDCIHALTAWDLLHHGPAASLAAWKRRIQDACVRAGIDEPSEASLRSWLTVLGEMRPYGAPED